MVTGCTSAPPPLKPLPPIFQIPRPEKMITPTVDSKRIGHYQGKPIAFAPATCSKFEFPFSQIDFEVALAEGGCRLISSLKMEFYREFNLVMKGANGFVLQFSFLKGLIRWIVRSVIGTSSY